MTWKIALAMRILVVVDNLLIEEDKINVITFKYLIFDVDKSIAGKIHTLCIPG